MTRLDLALRIDSRNVGVKVKTVGVAEEAAGWAGGSGCRFKNSRHGDGSGVLLERAIEGDDFGGGDGGWVGGGGRGKARAHEN